MRIYDPRQDDRWGVKYPLSRLAWSRWTWVQVHFYALALGLALYLIHSSRAGGMRSTMQALFGF
jgi:hypothetical protein